MAHARLGAVAQRALGDRGRRRRSAAGCSSAIAASSIGAPASTSARVGARLVNGAPGRYGCAGTLFHSTRSCSAPASASAPCTIVPDGSAQPPRARRRLAERRAPLEQGALRRERDAREAPAAVAHRLADQQQRRAGARREVGGEVRPPGGRGARVRRAPDPRPPRGRGWRSRRARARRAARAAPSTALLSGLTARIGRRRAWRRLTTAWRRAATGPGPRAASG